MSRKRAPPIAATRLSRVNPKAAAFATTLPALRAQPASTPLAHAQHPRSAGRAIFFTERDYRGDSLVVGDTAAIENLELICDSRSRPFNDRFRSVRIDGPVRVAVFEHSQFRGASTWINRTTPDLGAYSLGQQNKITWDRAISSLQVEPAPSGPLFSDWKARDAERAIRAAYRDVLNRDPDPEGARFYLGRLLDAGWSENQLRDAIRRSGEFRSRDFEAIVRRIYREVFSRDPDASGLAAYTRALSRGQTEAELRAELRRSREGDALSVTAAISRAYRDVLKRDPDPIGLENYRRLVRDKAWDEPHIREDLRSSEEYRRLPRP
ncbi:MAG: DUF4214 domain-containing protein [Undibacterium sp.]|nr:DUF4214 domain-containing protein [Opitutaceae bacterium]